MTDDGRKMSEFRRRKTDDGCQRPEVRNQRSKGEDKGLMTGDGAQKTDVRIQKSQAGMWKDECGRGKYSISNFRFGNAEEIKPFPQSTNPPINNLSHLNDINDHNDERLEWIKLNCHVMNSIRYI